MTVTQKTGMTLNTISLKSEFMSSMHTNNSTPFQERYQMVNVASKQVENCYWYKEQYDVIRTRERPKESFLLVRVNTPYL